jgi:two-component system sensor histidine kinase UhpB
MLPKAGILIVEDSFIVAYHLQTTLESEGYRVLSTQDSGEGALGFLERERPDLVLMDIMLNGPMDGIETARIVRSKYNLPIIYITALADKATIQRAKVTEPYGYLTKPFEDREIFTVIEMALYKHDIESRLRQSEEKYFSTVRSISDAVIVIDQHYCVTYLNPSAEMIAGWALSEAQGKPVFEILHLKNSETDEDPVNPIQCSLSTGQQNTMPDNFTLISKRGKQRHIGEGSMSSVIDSKGNFTGLVIIFKDISEKIEHENLVKSFETERRAALLEGQEKERSRIAKDLHDGLGQMLTAIKMNVSLVVSDVAKVDGLNRLIDEAIQESVRISENLLPSKLKDFDLGTCIRSLCNQIRNSTNLQVSFESLGAAQYIDQGAKINFYRIAQEAINNAIKHANASSITVQLDEEDDTVRLTIEDDGKGIAPVRSVKSHSAHHGLVNMRERAEVMGGKLTIESDTNRGTLIIVEVPLTNKTVTHAKV